MPTGKHKLSLKVVCQDRVPAIYVRGKNVVSDGSWLVTFEDKEWIDETRKAFDQSGTTWLKAGTWHFNDPQQRYANMFAIFFDYLDYAQAVKQYVLLKPDVPKITTP